MHAKPVPSAVDAGAQIQQMISIEILKAFFEPPLLNVKLTYITNNVVESIVRFSFHCMHVMCHIHVAVFTTMDLKLCACEKRND